MLWGARRLLRRSLGALIGAAVISACGGRSSLLDIDTWLEGQGGTAASGGATASGGAGGHGEAPLDPGHDEACGKGLKGPRMVKIPLPDGGSFCIDSTEVSNLQYAAFLQADTSHAQQPEYCAWNDDYTPDWWDQRPADNLPVVLVDWCDARAYCAWAGKRLCGKIGGGHITPGPPPDYGTVDPLGEEWPYACSAAGTRVYPYGNDYDETACVTDGYDGYPFFQYGLDHLRPIREATRCEGGFPGLYDMGGNAHEWVDESDKLTGENDVVTSFGGFFASDELDAKCVSRYGSLRNGGSGASGIRCCKDGP